VTWDPFLDLPITLTDRGETLPDLTLTDEERDALLDLVEGERGRPSPMGTARAKLRATINQDAPKPRDVPTPAEFDRTHPGAACVDSDGFWPRVRAAQGSLERFPVE
jgi:hypothetical protein